MLGRKHSCGAQGGRSELESGCSLSRGLACWGDTGVHVLLKAQVSRLSCELLHLPAGEMGTDPAGLGVICLTPLISEDGRPLHTRWCAGPAPCVGGLWLRRTLLGRGAALRQGCRERSAGLANRYPALQAQQRGGGDAGRAQEQAPAPAPAKPRKWLPTPDAGTPLHPAGLPAATAEAKPQADAKRPLPPPAFWG